MRTIAVAAAMILLLTAHANSQNLNMLGGLGDKRPLSRKRWRSKRPPMRRTNRRSEKYPPKNPPIRGELCVTPPHQRTVRDRFTVNVARRCRACAVGPCAR
jgi:hypothetical protein